MDELDLTSIIYDPNIGMELLSHDTVISFDLETTGLSPWKDNIALMQFYGNNTKTPVLVRINDGVIPDPVLNFFSEGGRKFVGHNVAGFDVLFLDTHGVNWKANKWYDTLIGECIISTTGRRDVSKNLKSSVRRRLGFTLDKNIQHGNWTANDLSTQQVTYAANDVLFLLDLMEEQVSKAETQGQSEALDMEMELAPVVAQMSLNGLPLVRTVLNEWLDEQRVVEQLNKKWLDENLGPINLNSPKQVLNALASKGILLDNTRAETLHELSKFGEGTGAEIAQHILDYKAPAQRVKMYQQAWQDRFITDDWVHARFWQTGTDTLRFSSSDPNLQQVPKDGRKVFGNIDGLTMVSADYSQIEVRIAAELAQDEKLKAVLDSEDVHREVAAQIYGVPAGKITAAQRRTAKAATFTLLFGGGPKVLYEYARNTGGDLTLEDAKEIFGKFFTAFDGLRRTREKAYAMAQNRRVVSIRLPNSAKRVLVGYNVTPTRILNTTVQGSAAIGMKYAMLEADRMGLMKYIGATVHDELVAAVPDKEAEEYGKNLELAMINGMHRAFPNMKVLVEVKYGRFWQA